MTIAVLGSANIDLSVRVARRPEPGETVFGAAFTLGVGGKGLNQAVAARRAGAAVRFLGAVGPDDFGARLRARMHAEGIDTARVRVVDTATGIAHIAVTDDGENTIVVVSGANASDAFGDADRAAIARSSHLVAQFERPPSLVRAAFDTAREAGVTTVLTPAPVIADAVDLLDSTDILVPNEAEACALAGLPDVASAAAALSRRSGAVVATLGARGALVARGGDVAARVPGRPVAAVDTTAAGDTFVGAMVAWLARGASLERSLEAATVAASLAVTRVGAADAMPRRDEIEAALS